MLTKANIKNILIWRKLQRRRNAWENKFSALFRISLNKQFRDLAERINDQNYNSIKPEFSPDEIEKRMTELYKAVGTDFARSQLTELKGNDPAILTKETEDIWVNYMANFVKRRLWTRIQSINQTSIEIAGRIINDALEESINEGLGAYETATKVKKNLIQKGIEYNQWRALRVARTEIMTASNIGSLEGAKASGEQLEKYWIATYDDRTRDTHMEVESQNPRGMNEGFRVGAWLMECPGDPDGGPEEVINCRCGIAFQTVGW